MFDRLSRFVTRYWLLVLVAWLVLLAGAKWLAPRWDDVTYDGDLAYLPSSMTTVRGEQLLAAAFPQQRARSQMVIVVERPDGPLGADDYAVVDRLAERFASLVEANRAEAPAQAEDATAKGDEPTKPSTAPRPGEPTTLPIIEVWSYRSEVVGDRLTSSAHSRHGQATLVVLQLTNEFMATNNVLVLDAVRQAIAQIQADPATPPGLTLGITGSAAVGGDMLASAKESIQNTELTTTLLVVAILLVVYRAPLLVVVPLAAIIVSASVAMDLVALAAQYSEHSSWLHFKIFKTTKIFIIAILFGSGTDFCLFLISRYREELNRGLDKAQALIVTINQVGTALAASALTTILGLGMMFFADFGKFRYSGPVIAVCLLVTLIACLTLAPALLRGMGSRVFWPFGVGPQAMARRQRDESSRFWNRLSELIIRRPGLILVASVAVMLYPAWQGRSVPISYNLVNELQATRASVQGTRQLQRHFSPGDTGPLTILAYREDGGLDTKQGEQQIATLTRLLYTTHGVHSVRSYAEPLGDKPGLFNPLSSRGRRKMAAKRHPRTVATYLSDVPEYAGRITRIDVVFDQDPFSIPAAQTLDRIDQRLTALRRDSTSPWHGTQFDYLGTTAGKRDLQAVIESDQTRIMQLVSLAVLGTIVVLLKRPLICLYLLLTVIFSYLVTIGLTEMFFSWLYAGTFEGLDWKVPIFLFVILVAVGEDYNIYLVTRVFEEQEKHGPLEGLRVAVAQTGGIITSCGVIMAGTFLSMMSGTLRGMMELGFALSLGIILDTFIVRTTLVPAFLALWCRLFEKPTKIPPDLASLPVQPAAPRRARPHAEPVEVGGPR